MREGEQRRVKQSGVEQSRCKGRREEVKGEEARKNEDYEEMLCLERTMTL